MTDGKETKSKYGALIQKAREQENQEAVKPDNQITREQGSQETKQPEVGTVKEKEVNLCVKVPESLRRHWAAESKRQGVTMTEVMMAALEARFGRPE
ncbi:hypothetical protein [Phormidesmis sp. 146-33]